MRSKLNFLINISLKKKIKSKWFLVANIVIGLLIVGLINLDSIITKFGGDFSDSTKIYISDETSVIAPSFEDALNIYVTNLFISQKNRNWNAISHFLYNFSEINPGGTGLRGRKITCSDWDP